MVGQIEPELRNLDEVRRAYEEMAGTWTGCDWPTRFGAVGLDLNGWSSAEAKAMAAETIDPLRASEWRAAMEWLAYVEKKADEAAVEGALALAAANAGCAEEAIEHARCAWMFEREVARPSPRAEAPTWESLVQAIQQSQRGSAHAALSAEPESTAATVERQIARLSEELLRLQGRFEEFARHPVYR